MCIYRAKYGICKKHSTNGVLSYCVDGPCPDEVLTNADRIRSMTDEELVVFLEDFSANCIECCENAKNQNCPIYKEGRYCEPRHIMEWLKQPAKEDNNA